MERSDSAHVLFAVVVVSAAALACAAGVASSPPASGAPGYALDSELVYRLEIGMVFFVALYLTAVVVRLALQGLTPSRLGTTSIDLPQVASSLADARDEARTASNDTADMLGELDDHEERIRALEQFFTTRSERRGNDV